VSVLLDHNSNYFRKLNLIPESKFVILNAWEEQANE
jgi:hypothetical protein